mgnify:CR=1 FL=1
MSDSKHIIDLLNLMKNNLKESMENSITVVVIHFLYIGHTKIVSDILNKKTIWKDNLNGDYLKETWIASANKCIENIEFETIHSE